MIASCSRALYDLEFKCGGWTASERTEQVNDTVRNTKVEVDENAGADSERNALFDREGQPRTSGEFSRERDPSTSRH